MISPNQPTSTGLTAPITLAGIQRTCDMMEGYVELGMFDEAIHVMRRLTSELRLSNDGSERFMSVLTKTKGGVRPAVSAAGCAAAPVSYA